MSEKLLKEKLARVEDDLRVARESRADAAKAREKAKEAYAELPDGADDAELFNAAMAEVGKVGEFDEEIAALSTKQVDLLKMIGDNEAVQRTNGGSPAPNPAAGWDSTQLFASDEVRAQLEHISGSKSRFGSMQLGEVATREMLVADVSVSDDMRRGTYRGVLPQLVRPLRVLDLIPTGTTDGNLVPYTQESGPLTGAAETAEGDAKPEAGITFTDADAPVRTIAAWMKLRKQSLSDFAALQSIVDGRLRYLVRRRLEGQILAGDGSGSNLRGILNTSGIGTVEFNADVPTSELVLSGITNVYLNEGEADGVVLNPIDWQTALTEKAQNAAGDAGSFEYVGGGPFGSTPGSLWGVAAIPSPALTQGTGLVGDFGIGVQLLVREGVNVLLSDSDQDDFIKNRVTMLGEMRAALPVWRPSVFQEVELEA